MDQNPAQSIPVISTTPFALGINHIPSAKVNDIWAIFQVLNIQNLTDVGKNKNSVRGKNQMLESSNLRVLHFTFSIVI